MGKGDKKTKRGKLFSGSFGVRRRKKNDKQVVRNTPVNVSKPVEKETKPVKSIKEIADVKEVKDIKEVKDTKVVKEAKVAKEAPQSKSAKSQVAPAKKTPKTGKQEDK